MLKKTQSTSNVEILSSSKLRKLKGGRKCNCKTNGASCVDFGSNDSDEIIPYYPIQLPK